MVDYVDYIELLLGEVFLGDAANAYLYVGDDLGAQSLTMGLFSLRVVEEGHLLTTVASTLGQVVVNGTQQFMFTHRGQSVSDIEGMKFDRIFIDSIDVRDRDRLMWNLSPHLAVPGGDFA